MGNLRVKVNVDYGDVEKLKSALKGIQADVDIKSASSKLKALSSQIKGIKDNKSIKMSFSTSDALSKLSRVKSELQSIEKLAGGLKLNFDSKAVKDMASNISKQLSEGTENAVKRKNQSARRVKSADTILNGNDDRTEAQLISDTKRMIKQRNKAMRALQESEYGTESWGIHSKEVTRLQKELENNQTRYGKLTGGKLLSDNKGIAETTMTEDYVARVKALTRQEKERGQALKDIVKNEKEYTGLLERADKHGVNSVQGQEYLSKASAIRDRVDGLKKEVNYQEELNKGSKRYQEAQEQITAHREQAYNRYRDAQLKEEERVEKARANATYKALDKGYAQQYKKQAEVSRLEAKSQAGLTNGNEEDKLWQAKQELDVITKKNKEIEKTGRLSNADAKKLANSNSIRKAESDAAETLARNNLKLARSSELYDKMSASMDKVHKMSGRLSTAGNDEARVINDIIRKEEARQGLIQNQIRNSGLVNRAKERDLMVQRQLNKEALEESELLRKAQSSDKLKERMSAYTLSDLINPRALYQDGKRALQYLFDNEKKVDDQLVNIAKVVDAPKKELRAFADTIYSEASKVGRSADEFGTSVERWASSGKTLKEAIRLGKLSTIGSFVGNVDEAAMVDYMSVPLQAFKKQGVEATDILNAMNEVANNNAIEMNDLGEAYKLAAGTASQAGTTFDQLTGLISGAQEVTRQGGSVIGNSLKAFDVNLGKIAARTTKMDQKKFSFFKNIGIDVVDGNNNIRSTFSILEDLNKVWKDLDSEQKATAGFYIAGKHHQNILAGLMDGWNYVHKAQQEAAGQLGQGEIGSAFQEFDKQKDSMQFGLVELKNAFSELMHSITGGKQGFNDGMKALTGGLKTLTELAKNPAIRELGGFLLKFGGVLAGLSVAKMAGSVGQQWGYALMNSTKESLLNPFKWIGKRGDSGLSDYVPTDMLMEQMAQAQGQQITEQVKRDLKGKKLTTGKRARWYRQPQSPVSEPSEQEVTQYVGTAGNPEPVQPPKGGWRGALTKLSKGMTTVFNTIGAIGLASTIVDAGLQAFTGKGLYQRVGETMEQIDRSMNKSKYIALDYVKASEKVKDSFNSYQEAKNLSKTVDGLVDSYKDLRRSKEEAYKKSGNIGDLELTADEFSNLAQRHNEMVDSLNAPVNLKLTVNDKDIIAAKQKATQEFTHANDLQKAFETLNTVREAQANHNYGSELAEYDKYVRDYQKKVKAQQTFMDNLKKTYGDDWKVIADEWRSDPTTPLSTLDRDVENAKAELDGFVNSKFLDDKQVDEFLRKTAENKKIMTTTLSNIIQGDDGAQNLQNVLKSPQATLYDFMGAIQTVNQELKTTDGIDQARESLSGMLTSFKETGDKVAASKAWSEIVQKSEKIGEISGEWLKENGFSNFGALLDSGDKDKIDSFFQAVSNGVDKAKKKSEELKRTIGDFAETFGLSGREEAEQWLSDFNNNRAQFVKNAFDKDVGAATSFFSINPNLLRFSYKSALESDMSIGDFYKSIQEQVDSLGSDENSIAIRYQLKNKNGDVDFNKVLENIKSLQENSTIVQELELRSANGGIDVAKFYSFLDENKKALVELGITSMGGQINPQDFIDKLSKGEISITTKTDENGQKLVEMVNKDGKTVTFKVNAEGNLEDLNPLVPKEGEETTVTKKVNIDVEPTIQSGLGANGNFGTQEYWNELFTRDVEIPQAIDVKPYIKEDGSVDVNAVGKQIQSFLESGSDEAVEIEKAIRVVAGLGENDVIGMDAITLFVEQLMRQDIDGIPSEVQKDILLLLLGQVKDEDTKAKIQQHIENLKNIKPAPAEIQQQINIKPEVVGDALNTIGNVVSGIAGAAGFNIKGTVEMDTTAVDQVATTAAEPVTKPVNADTTVATGVVMALQVLASLPATKTISGDGSAALAEANRVKSIIDGMSATIKIGTSGGGGGGRGGSSASVGIARGPIGTVGQAFSARIGGGTVGKNQSKASKAATVNEDVWRYWGKELYTGSPLDTSMDELTKALKLAKEDYKKMQELYAKQIPIMKDQIQYQKDLKALHQQELTDTIEKLKRYGFTASGNRITNLERAKSLSGDSATEAEKLLNTWKKNYETLVSIDRKLTGLNTDIAQANEDMKQASIKDELKEIKKTLKRTEALVTSVDNTMDLLNKKEGFAGNKDYGLKAIFGEEIINTASTGINRLIDDFNKLSTATIKHEENADEVEKVLEKLKSQILENADAILKYRESINQVRIDRLTNDYERFNNALSDGLDRLKGTVDYLKEGLLSGTKLGDLATSQFGELSYFSRDRLETDQQERLRLQAELDQALAAFSKKNIDREKLETEAVLSIQKYKYENLMKMASDFSSGKAITAPDGDFLKAIGLTGITDSKSITNWYADSWRKELSSVYDMFANANKNLVSQYESQINKARDGVTKQVITNNMILAQLNLQEAAYRKLVETNAKMIELAREELKNTTLTTEQRESLTDQVKEYEKAMIDAQKSIRDTVKSRFDFEFELIDKSLNRAKEYREVFEKYLEIASLLGLGTGAKQSFVDAVFAGKTNEYRTAKKHLDELIAKQALYQEGSYEWNLLEEKIKSAKSTFADLAVSVLNANRNVLENTLNTIKDGIEKDILGGSTLEKWKTYRDNWVTGIQKELELEALRKRIVDTEDKALQRRLEVLDAQRDVSKHDLEYLEKQLKVAELQKKLNNIEKERKVQTLIRNDDGTYDWGYVADQTEYDKTKKELNEANKDLEKYRQEQRQKYAESLGTIIEKANKGEYKTEDELRSDLDLLRTAYSTILGDIPEIKGGSYGDIIDAYKRYLASNGIVANSFFGGTSGASDPLNGLGERFELSFKNVMTDLTRIIATELKKTLLNEAVNNSPIHIDRIELPNVTDGNTFAEQLRGLNLLAKQAVNDKNN